MPKVFERRELLSNLQYLCVCSFVDDDDEAFEEYSNIYALVISSRYLTEISSVIEKEDFPGCVGFVDGTTLPLHQKPGIDGQSYFDRKHRYCIALQVVCDVDRRIISFLLGWPGSTHDATVYKACDLFKCPVNYFSSGQYILSDSAYPRSGPIIPCYRSPAALCPDNLEFNYCVAHSRVRNEHCIGILKGRWSSLRELRKPLNCLDDIVRIRDWVTACVVLHNMLAHLGDEWAKTYQEDDGVEESGMGDVGLACNHGDCPREKLKEITLRINRQRGFLPIA